MSNFNKQSVENLVTDIYNLFEITAPIENIYPILNKLNGIAISSKSCNITKTKDNGFIINFSTQESVSERYIISKMLGYLFLFMCYKIDDNIFKKKSFKSFTYMKNSQILNYFARAFLMPKNEFERLFEYCRTDLTVDTVNISEYFQVSLEDVCNRGKDLGLYKD